MLTITAVTNLAVRHVIMTEGFFRNISSSLMVLVRRVEVAYGRSEGRLVYVTIKSPDGTRAYARRNNVDAMNVPATWAEVTITGRSLAKER